MSGDPPRLYQDNNNQHSHQTPEQLEHTFAEPATTPESKKNSKMGDYGPEEHVSNEFPDSKCLSLHLTQATDYEKVATWNLNSANWGTVLSVPDYLEREAYLTTVPLAKDNGVTHWILVDRNLPPNERPILASCESLRKPVLVSQNGVITEGITHGIGSVFSQPKYRGRGYAARMLRELAPILKTWQIDPSIPGREACPFSILYSDIGTKYYAKLGWEVHPSNHISFSTTPTLLSDPSSKVKLLTYSDLLPLCALDEQNLRKELAQSSKDGKIHVALIPSYDQMQWHHKREDFVTNKLFQKSPSIKGGLAGPPGSRVWAIWTRAYYGPLSKPDSGNTFHILRLVLEDESDTSQNVESLKAILEMAKKEAKEWSLQEVDLWNPSDVVKSLVEKSGLEHEVVERKEESIASLMWYGKGSGKADEIRWCANEKFGWC